MRTPQNSWQRTRYRRNQLQSDIPYLDVKDLDNSGFQMGLNPIDKFYDLERNPYIPENEPVDISHIQITYLKD